MEVVLRSHLLVDVRKRSLVRVLHLRVLLSLTIHHGSLGVESSLKHLRTLGAILGARHLHGNVAVLRVVNTRNTETLHVRARRTAGGETLILVAKRRKLDGRSVVRRTLRIGRIVRDERRSAISRHLGVCTR